ncbi:MAG TPA: chemotaxis protein CheW [Azospirillaceae bacterium]|nr:chemotaxis protein CheW [Azospirillaceae bacterium]
MSGRLVATSDKGKLRKSDGRASADVTADYVTVLIGDQLLGLPVLRVQDILGPQQITRVPLAPPEVLGSLNLRGRIVTAIDVRCRLGLPPRDDGKPSMSVVVEHHGDLYSLQVDQVGEVMTLKATDYEANPSTMELTWREVSNGIYRLQDRLLVVVDVDRLLNFQTA